MSKNPFLNALGALFYIVCVSSLLYYGPKLVGEVEGVFVPVAMLSLFVLSATITGFMFLYQPVQMYLAGEREGASALLLKTVGVFGVFTALIFTFIFFYALLLQ